MGKTPIEWADHSINPFRAKNLETGKIGHFCVKVSPGCKNCYSSAMQSPWLTQLEFIAENREKVELFLEEKALEEVMRRRVPTTYFWCDMTDMFLEDYPDSWIDRCVATMCLTNNRHTHLVLTKRHDRLRDYMNNAMPRIAKLLEPELGLFPEGIIWPPRRIRFGVSVENRKASVERIEALRNTKAETRFLSIEPLLEDVCTINLDGIDWVIAGSESGKGARPAVEGWYRSIKNQCVAAGVPFFLKQYADKGHKISLPILDGKQWTEVPE